MIKLLRQNSLLGEREQNRVFRNGIRWKDMAVEKSNCLGKILIIPVSKPEESTQKQ